MKSIKLTLFGMVFVLQIQAQNWTDLNLPPIGTLGIIQEIAYDSNNDILYTHVIDQLYFDQFIFQLKNGTWSVIAESFSGNGLNDILVDASGNLVVLGGFTGFYFGGSFQSIQNRTFWDGASWNAYPALTGESSKGVITSLGQLIVKNNFETYDWDGTNWNLIATGASSDITDFVLDQNDVMFTSSISNGIKYYDGSTWITIASSSPLAPIWALAFDSANDLIAGGKFDIIDGVNAKNIARWDGTTWHAMNNGLDHTTPSISEVVTIDTNIDGTVYAGGNFDHSGSNTMYSISTWDGTDWNSVGNGLPYCYDLTHDDQGLIYVNLYTASAGNQPVINPIESGIGIWEPKGPYKIESLVYADLNANLIKESTEPFVDVGHLKISATAPFNSNYNSYQNANGEGEKSFILPTQGTLAFQNPPASYSAILSKNNFDLNTIPCDQVTIALQANTTSKDLNIEITPTGGRQALVRPGFNSEYIITIENIGTQIIPSAQATIDIDPNQSYDSSIPLPATVFGNTVTWSFNNLTPFDKKSIHLIVTNATIPSLNLGDVICNNVQATPLSSDFDPTNNTALLKQITQGSYDPNDKNESHGGIISSLQATNQEWLNYHIRFQNTGTDTAFTITVKDTLDDLLDGTSLEILASSHLNDMIVQDDKYIQWRFDSIDLVDSFTNEALSHGSIHCRIKPKPGMVLGDEVLNQAAIYFDYNPAIYTNDHSTLVSDDNNLLSGLNNCLHFDGVDDHVECNSPLNGNSDYTVEAWFYSENTGNTNQHHRIIGWTGFDLELADANGTLRFYDNNTWINTGVNIRDASWHHVAVTRSGPEYKLYLDGVMLTSYLRNNTLNLSTPFRIGTKSTSFLGESWKGRIDNVRIWNTALAANKILAGIHCPVDPNEIGLVAMYQFNQGNAGFNNTGVTSLVDAAENNDGTLQNFSLAFGNTSNWITSDAQDANSCIDGLINSNKRTSLAGDMIDFSYYTNHAYTTLEIDFGDGLITAISGPSGFTNHSYSLAGLYTAALLVDGQCVDTKKILVQSCEWEGWTSSYASNVVDETYGSCLFINGSNKEAYLSPSQVSISDYDFHLQQYKYFGIDGDDIAFEVSGQNNSTAGGLGDFEITLKLFGTEGEITTRFATQISSTLISAPGLIEAGLSDLQTNTQIYQSYSLHIQNETDLSVYINNTLVSSKIFKRPIGNIVGIGISYHGSGTTDEVSLKTISSNVTKFVDVFSSCDMDCPCVYDLDLNIDEKADASLIYKAHNRIYSTAKVPMNTNIEYQYGTEMMMSAPYEVKSSGTIETMQNVCPLYCGTERPLHELAFLKDRVSDYRIDHCTLNGQDVFYIVNCQFPSDTRVFDCAGNEICVETNCSSILNLLDCISLDGC